MRDLGKMGLGFALLLGSGHGFAKVDAADANERHQIQMYDQVYQGQTTIHLKQLLKQQNPRLDLSDANLKEVILVAKSRNGNARAQLSVGNSSTGRAQIIPGNPQNFQDNRPYSYAHLSFLSPGQYDNGAWKINLAGNVKIKRIAVVLKTDRQEQVALDNFRVPANGTREVISVNLSGVTKIKLVAPQDAVGVQKVVAVFANGQRKDLSSLEGRLQAGASKVFELGAANGRNVRQLIIVATCPPRSSFAKLRVVAVVLR